MISCMSIYEEPEVPSDRSMLAGANPKILIYTNSVDLARMYHKKIEGWGVCDRFFKIYVYSQLANVTQQIKKIKWVYGTTLNREYCIHQCVVYYE